MKTAVRKFATVLLALMVSIGVGESVLRLLTAFPTRGTRANRIAHPDLGYVMDPALGDVDEHGFRNPPGAFGNATIAVIGDSLTQGYNVTSRDSFPYVIARKTSMGVYNYGVGGYGFYQYRVLFDEALKHGYDTVVLGLFPWNDLDTSCIGTQTDYWRSRDIVIPPCRGSPYLKGPRPLLRRISEAVKYSATNDALRVLVWLKIKSALIARGWTNGGKVIPLPAGNGISRNELSMVPSNISLDDSVVSGTLKNSKMFLRDAKAEFDRGDIRFVVVLIPSKILALHRWTAGKDMDPDAASVAIMEQRLIDEYKAFLESESIAFVDALPYVVSALAKSVEGGALFYPPMDSHPYAEGYEAYADAVIDGLRLIER